jgi:fructokinase
MLAPQLIHLVRQQYAEIINNYLGQSSQDIENLIVTPGLGDDAGLFGGARLAQILITSPH